MHTRANKEAWNYSAIIQDTGYCQPVFVLHGAAVWNSSVSVLAATLAAEEAEVLVAGATVLRVRIYGAIIRVCGPKR